jgi:sugar phosphate isomerase/epimerase
VRELLESYIIFQKEEKKQMEKGTIGVMLMMVKQEVAEKGVYAVMQRLKDIGFNAVEVSQIPMTPEFISELKRACRELDMKVVSLSCGVGALTAGHKYPGDTLEEDYDKIVADCKNLNCDVLRIGMMPLKYLESDEASLEFIRICEDYALRLKKEGINLYYHPHHMEMIHYNKKPLMDTMRDQTKCLGFELDTHWMWRGGVDPEKYVRTFKNRIRLLHLKDYRIGRIHMDQYPVPEKEKTYYMFKEIVEFAEVGEGALDFPAIIKSALESGTEYFLIEQDRFYGRDPFDSIKISHDNLVKMGFGDWFNLN